MQRCKSETYEESCCGDAYANRDCRCHCLYREEYRWRGGVNVMSSRMIQSRVGDRGLIVFASWFLDCDVVQNLADGRYKLLSFSGAFSAGFLDWEQPTNSWHEYNFRATQILQAATRCVDNDSLFLWLLRCDLPHFVSPSTRWSEHYSSATRPPAAPHSYPRPKRTFVTAFKRSRSHEVRL